MLMSAVSSSPTWRTLHVTVAAAGAFGLVLLAAPSDAQTVPSAEAQASVSGLGAAAEDHAVRPFHINVPEEALVDLREGGHTSSRQPGLTEGNRRNYGYHARCAGLSTERSL
jgi:hypothetical protein